MAERSVNLWEENKAAANRLGPVGTTGLSSGVDFAIGMATATPVIGRSDSSTPALEQPTAALLRR